MKRSMGAGLLLVVSFAAEAAYPAIEARVGEYNGRMVFYINDTPVAPFMYAGTGNFSALDRNEWFRQAFRDYAGLGFRLFQLQIDLNGRAQEDVDLRLAVADAAKKIRALLDICPDAAVFLRVVIDAPQWYVNQHPDEWIGYAGASVNDGKPGNEKSEAPHISLASAKWRDDTTRVLRDWLTQLAALPESDAVAGIHIAGGQWHEWFWNEFPKEPDTGPAMTRYFRAWLRNRYATDAALQHAWNDPAVTFETAAVPGLSERYTGKQGVFRDPSAERKMIDYGLCHQEVLTDLPLHFCRLVKETWPRPVVTGVFHGYMTHIHDMVTGGHLGFRRLLESPYVDYLSGPLSYEPDSRRLGGPGMLRSLSLSFRLHKKLWMSEMDQIPFSPPDEAFRGSIEPFHQADEKGTVAAIRRNVAQSLVLGQGLWLYDFGVDFKGKGRAYAWPAYKGEIQRLKSLADRIIDQPYTSPADVLFVYDPRCFYYLGYQFFSGTPAGKTDTFGFEAINRTLADAYHSGIAFDTVLLEDLPLVDLRPYKAVVYAFTPYMTEEDRLFARERVARDGRTVVWVYAPGYTDGKTLDLERMNEVTGMRLTQCPITLPPEWGIPEGKLGPHSPEIHYVPFVLHSPTNPLFRIDDPEAESIALYTGTSYVAVASKKLADSTAWFCATPLRSPLLMRTIFERAGAHIYSRDGDVVLAGSGILGIHTEFGGKRTVSLPNGRRIRTTLPPLSTGLFNLETGKPLEGYVP